MTKTSETIVYFGSGPVAAKSLELLSKTFSIEAVVTKPKPAHHRGDFPVIDLATKLGLPIKTVASKQELSELIAGQPFKSKLAILIDFGIIVTKDVIEYFPLGIVNSHFSLLPEWRGADPITFALLSGQAKTGVSLMLIDEGMDTGKLLTHKTHHIAPDATADTLTNELIELSDQLLTEFIPKYTEGELKPRQQPHIDRATYSRKLTKQDGQIDWTKPAQQIEREIRAYSQWPKSYTVLINKELIITTSFVIDAQGQPGQVFQHNKDLAVYCGQDALVVKNIKPSGKAEMTSQAFLAGLRIKL